MKTTWNNTAILTLILIGVMQVLPFVPSHSNCQDACCVEVDSCCDAPATDGCEMAMTSCSVSLFIPLISAPLIKIDSNIQLDMDLAPTVIEVLPLSQQRSVIANIDALREAPPPA